MLSSNNPLRHNDFYDLWPLLGNAGVNISRLAAPSGCLVGRLRYILRPFSNYRLKTIGRPIIEGLQQSSRDRHPQAYRRIITSVGTANKINSLFDTARALRSGA
jgi:hypothetical protein